MSYSFTLIIKKYERISPTLDDMSSIHNHNTCLVSKNTKHGGVYIHKTGKIIKGKFLNSSGSVRYPILFNKTEEVHIRYENFLYNPDNIRSNQFQKQDIISVIDIIKT